MNHADLSENLVQAIQCVVGPTSISSPVSLHEPNFQGTNAISYVNECLNSGWVSTAGKWVRSFEQSLEDTTGSAHAIAVSNGTVALRLALHLAGVGPGDEVLIPPISFVATANAVSHLNAIPHFVDIEPDTLGMSPRVLSDRLNALAFKSNGNLINRETGRRISAVVAVHVLGHPADVRHLRSLSDDWGIPLIEDAAEALGSRIDGTHCGLFGQLGTLSFNGNKILTTGGGGAVLTNDSNLALKARHLSTTAKLPHPWDFHHDFIAWNDRLPNLNAALGCAQLEDLNRRLLLKRRIAQNYASVFSNFHEVEFISEPSHCTSNYWLSSIRFTSEDPTVAKDQKLSLLHTAHKAGLLLRPLWIPLNTLPMYRNCPSTPVPNGLEQADRIVSLPSSPQLSDDWS